MERFPLLEVNLEKMKWVLSRLSSLRQKGQDSESKGLPRDASCSQIKKGYNPIKTADGIPTRPPLTMPKESLGVRKGNIMAFFI